MRAREGRSRTTMASPMALGLVLAAALLVHTVHADTACQRARERDLKSSNPYVIHECDSDGNYVAKQKTVGTPHWYWCFDRDGEVLTGPSKKIEVCTCPLAQLAARSSTPPRAVPSCANTGHFNKEQRDETGHWCVNRDTGAKAKDKVPLTANLSC